jgi:cytochrome c oxidase subunit 2
MRTNLYYFSFGLLIITTLLVGCSSEETDSLIPAAVVDIPSSAGDKTTDTKIIEIKASQYVFEPAEIVVNQGDKVKLILKSIDVAHGIAIKDYNVKVFADVGEESAVEFTANKSGTFSFYCNVFCGGGHKEMQGKLIVK